MLALPVFLRITIGYVRTRGDGSSPRSRKRFPSCRRCVPARPGFIAAGGKDSVLRSRPVRPIGSSLRMSDRLPRADVHAPVRALLDEAERMRRRLVWRDARVSWLCSGEARMAVVVRAAAVLSAAVVSLPVLTALANDEDPRQPRRSLRHFRCRRLRCGLVSVCAVCLLSRLGSMLWWRATPCLFSIPDVRSSRVSLLVAVGPVACGRLQVLTLTSSSVLFRVDVGDELEPSRVAAYFR